MAGRGVGGHDVAEDTGVEEAAAGVHEQRGLTEGGPRSDVVVRRHDPVVGQVHRGQECRNRPRTGGDHDGTRRDLLSPGGEDAVVREPCRRCLQPYGALGQAGREGPRDRPDAVGRQADGPAQHAPPHQVEHPGGSLQFVLQEDPRHEGAEERLDERVGEPGIGERGAGGGVRASFEPAGGQQHVAGGQQAEGGQVARAGEAARQQFGKRARPAGGIAEVEPARRGVDEEARREGPQSEFLQGEAAPDLGVGGVEHLEPPIHDEAPDPVRTHPAADRVARLDHPYAHAGRPQIPGARQPGDSGPDDQHVRRVQG